MLFGRYVHLLLKAMRTESLTILFLLAAELCLYTGQRFHKSHNKKELIKRANNATGCNSQHSLTIQVQGIPIKHHLYEVPSNIRN
jgi:hypothetical protein